MSWLSAAQTWIEAGTDYGVVNNAFDSLTVVTDVNRSGTITSENLWFGDAAASAFAHNITEQYSYLFWTDLSDIYYTAFDGFGTTNLATPPTELYLGSDDIAGVTGGSKVTSINNYGVGFVLASSNLTEKYICFRLRYNGTGWVIVDDERSSEFQDLAKPIGGGLYMSTEGLMIDYLSSADTGTIRDVAFDSNELTGEILPEKATEEAIYNQTTSLQPFDEDLTIGTAFQMTTKIVGVSSASSVVVVDAIDGDEMVFYLQGAPLYKAVCTTLDDDDSNESDWFFDMNFGDVNEDCLDSMLEVLELE